MTTELVLLLIFLPIILASAVSDFQHLKIRNLQVLVAFGLFATASPFLLGIEELSIRLMAAALTFSICFVLFSLRLIGGGDAKMMPVVILFIPSGELVLFLRIFAGALLLVSLGSLFLQRTPGLRRPGWASAHDRRQVPVGVAMALAVVALTTALVWGQ
jgi:prepilin peptidase CpaA